jgi:effector-binding domain-containing protein
MNNSKTKFMKIIRLIFFIFLGLVALILIVGLFLPKSVKIISETEINLTANKVFYSMATFSDRASWDPWVKEDTTVKISIVPVEGYVGSRYSWTSKNSGSGEMVIDSVVINHHISLTLSFDGMSTKPHVWNDFYDRGDKTLVSWGFYQDASYPVGRIFMAFMKSKLQTDYDKGLANLKSHLEEKGVNMSSLSEILVENVPPFYAFVSEGKGRMDEISSKMPALFSLVASSIKAQGLEITGPPFNHYIYFDSSKGISVFAVGFPVNKPGKSTAEVKSVFVPGFSALEAIHNGPYSEFGDSYAKFMKHIEEKNIKVNMETWEFYLSDTMKERDEMKWKTLIAFPLKK